jgi:hypothetical protein
MTTSRFTVAIVICSLVFGLTDMGLLQARMESSNYIIESDVFSSGGNELGTSPNYTIRDTIGEDIILSATTTSANYGIKAGFRELYTDQFITLHIPDAAIDFGNLSASEVRTATHTMTVSTNATNGFTATVSGATLTKGGDTIAAIGAAETASTPGTPQFGLNLVANTGFGANPAGSAPIGAAADHYRIADSFAFQSGDTVATSTSAINTTTYTASYIANISSATPAGDYTTTLTYSATGSF